MPAFSLFGYTGTMRPVWSPIRSTIGFVIWREPRNSSHLPKMTAVMPARSVFVRQAWLKNVIRSLPVRSLTSTNTMVRLLFLVRRLVTFTISTMTMPSSPGKSSSIVVSFVRSMYRRG